MEKPISSKTVLECPIFKVEEARVELSDGSTATRWYVLTDDASFVIPVDNDGNIILIREWRSANQAYFIRIVAGKIDKEEKPEDAAMRELREEIGMGATSLEFFANIPAANGWQKQNKYFYIARGLYDAPLDTGDEDEMPTLHPTAPDKILEMIDKGEIIGDIALALRRFIVSQK